VNTVLQNWGLSNEIVTLIDSPSKSTWDIGGKYVLKRIVNATEFTRSVQFTEALTAEGIPVARYIPTNNGTFTTSDGQYSLMGKLVGGHVDFFHTPDLAFPFGQALARLHVALARMESHIVCDNCDLEADWLNNIKPNIHGMVSDDLVTAFETIFLAVYPRLPRQIIHRDVHCFNFLFEGDKLTGWLDFELGHRNARVFDLAYFLAGLLVGKELASDNIAAWGSIYRMFLGGYNEVSPLAECENVAIPVLMVAIELLFVSFWKQQENIAQCEQACVLAQWLFDRYITKSTVV